jgi:hypothetical protein
VRSAPRPTSSCSPSSAKGRRNNKVRRQSRVLGVFPSVESWVRRHGAKSDLTDRLSGQLKGLTMAPRLRTSIDTAQRIWTSESCCIWEEKILGFNNWAILFES